MTGRRAGGERRAPARSGGWVLAVLWLFSVATLHLFAGVVTAQDVPIDDEPVARQEGSFSQDPDEPDASDFEDALAITTPVFLEGDATGEQLEIVIHRWTGVLPPLEEDEDEPRVELAEEDKASDAEPQRFTVSVGEHPAFIKNISWVDGPELVFEPGESSKTVTLVFDTAAEGETGLPEEEAELVLVIEARDDTVEPRPRELVVPLVFKRALTPGEATVTVCALRGDAPEEFPIEEAYQHCDPDRVPVLRYDRAVVFFTPARDLREPIGEAQYFAIQILGPNGDRVTGASFWNKGTVEEPELSMPFTVEGSPGRLAVPLRLWDLHDDPDPSKARKGPGTYTVQTADVRVEGSAVWGQGEGTPVIDGEWQDEGTFEIGDREFEFKTFVAEQAGEVHFPYNPRLRLGKVNYGEPQINGNRVVIDLSTEWRWHAKEAQQASSRLVFEFPERLLPGFETAGEMTASLEQLAVGGGDYAFVFTAGVHDPVATTTKPPRRALAGSEAPVWTATRKEEIGRRHDTADGSRCDGEWVWTQGESVSYDRREIASGSCTFSFLGIRTARDAWGEPVRDLASHLHDPDSLLVIPVFYAVRGETRGNLGINGYAIYGVGQDPYEGPPPAEGPEGGIGPAAPPVLKLKEIVGRRGTADSFDYTDGQPGFSERNDSHWLEGGLIASITDSARLLGLPLEIRHDQPFEVSGELARRIAWGPEVECEKIAGVRGELHASSLGGEFVADGLTARSGCRSDHPRADNFRNDTRPEDGGTASMTLRLTPLQSNERGTTEVDFYFSGKATTPSRVKGPDDDEGILFTWDYTRPTTPDGYLVPDVALNISSGVTIQLSTGDGSVNAIYGPVEAPDEGVTSVPPYDHPVVASTTPPGETTPGEEIVPPVPVGDTDVVTTTGVRDDLEPPGTTGVRDGFDPNDPRTWDPNKDPDVANHIRTWLAAAEPPDNAVPGSNFRYDEFGRTVGIGATVREVSRHDSVDYSTGTTPEATVWTELRAKLDSIDHCLLEEYVVTKVRGGSIEHCRGRYGAVRDLGGVPLAEARAEVQGGGFEVQLAPGPPAPSPELDGAVEGQDPPATQYLRRGQTLTLTVYAPYVPEATVPDLVGLSRAEAKERLEDEGLIVVLRPGAPARSPAESDTIESQQPEAGTVLEPGAEVAVWVRPAFVAAATIPDLVGLSTGEARAALTAAGIDGVLIDLVPGSAAPTPALAGRIEAQEPAAGWTVEPGTRVRLTVHSVFVDLRTVPSVIGLSTGEAKRRLAAVGLEVRLAPGPPASSPGAENTVQTQSPDGGASVGADSVVTLTIHSPWVPPPTAVPPPPPPTAVPPIAVPTAVSGTGGGLLPLPDLRCPEYVILRSSSDLCIGNNPNAPPIGSRLPLDRAKSGYNHSPGAVQYGRYSFECYYRIEPYFKNFMFIRWEHGQYQGPGYPVPCQDRREGGRFGGNYSFYSPTHHVEAMLNGNCFNAQENEATARNLIRQTEPFARPCAGAIVQPPTPVPPPPTNTPVPPAAPPQCPGPNAPAIFTLIDPPPYAGRSAVCRDGSGSLWINISNNVRPVTGIQQGTKDPNSECWWGTRVVTPVHTYEGTLCSR